MKLSPPDDPPKKTPKEKIEEVAGPLFDKKIAETDLHCVECGHKIEPKPKKGEPEVDVVAAEPEKEDKGPPTLTIKNPQTYTLKG